MKLSTLSKIASKMKRTDDDIKTNFKNTDVYRLFISIITIGT